MASPTKIIYHVVTALVFLLFLFASIMKLTPALNPDLHNEMVSFHFQLSFFCLCIVLPSPYMSFVMMSSLCLRLNLIFIKVNFRRFSDVFPLASFGFKPDPELYRMCVACAELVCALLLYLGNRTANQVVNLILFCIMVGAIYTHYAIQDPVDKMGGAIVGLALVLIRSFIMMTRGTEVKIKIG